MHDVMRVKGMHMHGLPSFKKEEKFATKANKEKSYN